MDGKWNWVSVRGSPVKSTQEDSPVLTSMIIEGDQIEFNYGGDYEGHLLMEDGHIKFKIKGMRMSVGIEPPIQDVLQGFDETHRYNIFSNQLKFLDDQSKVIMEFKKVA